MTSDSEVPDLRNEEYLFIAIAPMSTLTLLESHYCQICLKIILIQ